MTQSILRYNAVVRLLSMLLVGLVAAACGNGTEPPSATALALTGQPSEAQAGVVLPSAPEVELRDGEDSPVERSGVMITVSIASGGGTLGGTTSRATDADGRAVFSDLVITGRVGPRVLQFAASGLTAASTQPIVLSAGTPASMAASSSLTPTGTVATAVTPAVVVRDASGNPVAGTAVTFAGAPGSGVAATTAATDANGIAALAGWTLPTKAGQYAVTATASELSGSPVIFTVTAVADAPHAMEAAGGGQSALYGSVLPSPLEVQVTDRFGNPTPGVAITWADGIGGGTVTPEAASTNALGVVRATYRLGTTPGAKLIRASVGSNPSIDIAVTARGFTDQLGTAIHHSCALDEAGVAFCWGDNERGQAGDGSTVNRTVPTAVGGALRFRRISVGTYVTCAVTTDNVPYCWGSNAYGSVGDGTTTDRSAPTPVAGGHRFTEIATSGRTTCGLTAAGAAYCWGSDEWRQLGAGDAAVETCTVGTIPATSSIACSRAPVAVAGGRTFSSITVGLMFACALETTGALYCWGNRFAWGGALNGTQDYWGAPTSAGAGLAFIEVSAGNSHVCGIVAPAATYCWGSGSYGMLGTGEETVQQDTPALLPNTAASRIGVGEWGSCAALTDGRAACWGYNDTGGVGDGTTTLRVTPTIVSGPSTFTFVSSSGYHGCGRIANGQVYCWGNNAQGQLGNGGGPDHREPVLARP